MDRIGITFGLPGARPRPVTILPRRFSILDAARELGVSPATVQREIAAGRLACYRLGPKGKKIQVGEHHLGEYLACREAKSSASATT